MTATYDCIATNTLSGTATSVTFSSIPQTFTDLILIANSDENIPLIIRVGNNSVDTGSNYSNTWVRGNGTSTSSGRQTNGTYFDAGAADPGEKMWRWQFLNYANTNMFKSVNARTDKVDNTYATMAFAGLWRGTSAINIMTISAFSGSFAANDSFTLYGIKAE